MRNKVPILGSYIFWMLFADVIFLLTCSFLLQYQVVQFTLEQAYAIEAVGITVPVVLAPLFVITVRDSRKDLCEKSDKLEQLQ